jgi:hypothetical protein
MSIGADDHDDLRRRLDMFERRYRILKRAGTMAALVLLSLTLLSATAPKTPKTVEAQSFVITDVNGKQRGAFGVTAQGEPGLVLLDDRGRHRIRLRVTPDGMAALGIFDGNGTLRLTLGSGPDGEALLILDAHQTMRVALAQYPSGSAALTFLDKGGKTTWAAPKETR